MLLLLTVLLGAQERPPETCHVAGATSDAEGRFSMIQLDPGVYHLKGNRSGYLETAYGSRATAARSTISSSNSCRQP